MKTAICILLVALAIPVSLLAADIDASQKAPAAAAFEHLKALAGTWQVDGNMGKGQSVFEVVSNGSTVLERFTEDGMPSPMITAYHLNGDKLELTHYCMTGNQPSMAANSIDSANREIVFDFVSISNLTDPNGKYMHNASFKFADNDHFTSDWTLYENAKPKLTANLQYTRVK